MRVKVASCAAMFWDGGTLVWDDYVRQKQIGLTERSESVVRWFSAWREIDTAGELGSDAIGIAKRLLEEGVLIEEGSVAHLEEVRLLTAWRAWGSAGRHFHFATRSPAGSRYLSVDSDLERTRQRAAVVTPPAAWKPDEGPPRVSVPRNRPDDAAWTHRTLLDALYARRSVRTFDGLTLDELGAIVRVAAGIVDERTDPELGTAVYRTSPSPGACNPIEVYVIARDVDGLEPGVYRFAPDRSTFELVAPAVDDATLLEALGGQAWLAAAPALLVWTGVIERSAWRYATPRAYRDMLIALGHMSQTALLTATAMGVGSVVATAVCDEELETIVGADGAEEVVLAVSAFGRVP